MVAALRVAELEGLINGFVRRTAGAVLVERLFQLHLSPKTKDTRNNYCHLTASYVSLSSHKAGGTLKNNVFCFKLCLQVDAVSAIVISH